MGGVKVRGPGGYDAVFPHIFLFLGMNIVSYMLYWTSEIKV